MGMCIEFGAMAPLPSQQVELGDKAQVMDRLTNSITTLHPHGLLTEGETKRARERLVEKMIEAAAHETNRSTAGK